MAPPPWDARIESALSERASKRTLSFAMCRTIGSSSITSESAMPAPSSSEAGWSSRLEPLRPHENVLYRPDDPRLADRIVGWQGDLTSLVRSRAVLVGFPQDDGVRRNAGR